jgi:thymidylate synthase ThyX
MSGPSAAVIAHSRSPLGAEVATLHVKMHRFVLAEFNTHRVFSRNSASSRAIPFPVQLERVLKDPAMPLVWASERKGMSGGDEIDRIEAAESLWMMARDEAVFSAKRLHRYNVHKSIINRLLEPFMWHDVIVTSTEWTNFFDQRCSPLAQPEMRVAAEAMRTALEQSTPRELKMGEWHTPYVKPDDAELDVRLKVSTARCARVSYRTHDGTIDIDADLALFDKLVSARPGHWSPLEHVCTPEPLIHTRVGNLNGFRQLRHEWESR